MLEVTVPAATTALTTLDRVKAGLGITDDLDDEYLEAMIAEQSDYVCALLNIAMADDGTRTCGLETVSEALIYPLLSRVPVVEILGIWDGNGEPLNVDDYRFDKVTGRIYGSNWRWMNIVYNFTPPIIPLIVSYTAGWKLPGDDGRNLPHAIEGATVSLISTARSSRGRAPNVRAEDIPGVIRTEYWVGDVGEGGIPADVMSQLSMYRRHSV